ncbi:hypothetical protein Tco_1549040 [Tanacetum coccineum]
MEKLESENVSLEFQVQSLIKERENVKTEYQKLFDSIKKTRAQTQGEINELIEKVKQKTYAYADVRAQNEDLLLTISELKAKLKTVENGKSVNTKFDKANVSKKLLCVTPSNKQVFQKKIVFPKTEEKHVLSKTVTLQTSPNKQQAVGTNENVIAPGMYKVGTSQVTNTNKAKSVLSSTGLSATSSVRRPSNMDSSFKNSVISNTKNSSKKVEVSDRTNKKPDVESKNVALNTFETNDEIKNALIVKNVLCVSCAKNVLIPCHDNCCSDLFVDCCSGCSKPYDGDFHAKKFLCRNSGDCLGHNLFSVGQFCDGDLEVAFRSKTCYVRNLEGDDLLTGDRKSNLYTISIPDMAASSLVCLMSKASSTKSCSEEEPFDDLKSEYEVRNHGTASPPRPSPTTVVPPPTHHDP